MLQSLDKLLRKDLELLFISMYKKAHIIAALSKFKTKGWQNTLTNQISIHWMSNPQEMPESVLYMCLGKKADKEHTHEKVT